MLTAPLPQDPGHAALRAAAGAGRHPADRGGEDGGGAAAGGGAGRPREAGRRTGGQARQPARQGAGGRAAEDLRQPGVRSEEGVRQLSGECSIIMCVHTQPDLCPGDAPLRAGRGRAGAPPGHPHRAQAQAALPLHPQAEPADLNIQSSEVVV